eukprot:11210871-Lingulodinium_polyedra.AAC.1
MRARQGARSGPGRLRWHPSTLSHCAVPTRGSCSPVPRGPPWEPPGRGMSKVRWRPLSLASPPPSAG